MALESASAAELIQSNADDDLEDGEIPSDEDDEPVPVAPAKPPSEPAKSSSSSSSKNKASDSKSSKSKKSSKSSSSSGNKTDRFGKYKNPSEDWAGDVEKAILAVLEEDKSKDSKSRSKSSSRNRSKKRTREDKEEDRAKEQKKRKVSDDENGNEDDDEMLFVRGASPVRKDQPECSPTNRRSHERDNFDNNSDRDSDDRSSRHRDSEKRSSGRGSSNRRGGSKNERGCKNKNRGQARNDRNSRRSQPSDHNQDPDSICVYYMQGKCHRGDDCPFSHNALPPRKMELCKFYLMDCCAKRDKCLYMHHDFPCKFFHTGLKCNNGDNCKFSHDPLNEQVKNILLKHLETAPKEILGDFPRLSRDGAMMMINNTARNLAQGNDAPPPKIPSLFDVPLPAPTSNSPSDKDEEMPLNNLDPQANQLHKRLTSSKERKAAAKKTRWGSDEDRVPLEQIMLLQSVSQLGLHIPALSLAAMQQQQIQQRILLQQCIANMEFYNEIQGSPSAETEEGKTDKEDGAKESNETRGSVKSAKDIDLRQLLSNGPKPTVVSIADEAANLAKLVKCKFDDESDHDEESDLVIAVPCDDEDKIKENEKDKANKSGESDESTKQVSSTSQGASSELQTSISDPEIPPNLPKKTQELFLRIQQQQRAANDSMGVDDKAAVENVLKSQEDWYSDEDDEGDNDDDDDEEEGSLQIVLKDSLRDESEKSDQESPTKEQPLGFQPPAIPQPAEIADTLGDLSKIDISDEVTKLLSAIKPQSGSSKKSSIKVEAPSTSADELEPDSLHSDKKNFLSASENGTTSPTSKNSPSVSRDPRMSRDPRQRRIEETKPISPSRSEVKKESGSLRLETSIYSSGITAMDSGMDTDLRARLDQDHRRKDMDLRQHYQDFGDTDLRVGYAEGGKNSDIDLRQMLSLPFKPVPSHVPCTEIDASIASHPAVIYKVYVVDIPRPNYTGLKLTKNDALVKYDPRLRKIFRLPLVDIADSPMSPPPMSKHDSPKSPPPQIRVDPRRKALEATMQPSQGGGPCGMMSGGHGGQQQPQDLPMGMPGPVGMGMPMGQNPMMGNMGPIGPLMGGPLQPPNMPPMGMGGMGNVPPGMGPNGPPMGPNQGPMGFDPRYRDQRNGGHGGPGLLGPAPVLGFPDRRDVGPNYDGPPYPSGNFGNFGPLPNEPMMGYGPSGPNNMNFGGNGPDWSSGNQNIMRRGGRMRRRNRNRSNAGSRNNRSPP